MCIIARRRHTEIQLIIWHLMTDVIDSVIYQEAEVFPCRCVASSSSTGRRVQCWVGTVDISQHMAEGYYNSGLLYGSTLNLDNFNPTWCYDFNVPLQANDCQGHLLLWLIYRPAKFAWGISFIVWIKILEWAAKFVAWIILSSLSLWNS